MPAKYLNTPETPLYKKSHVLYGLDLARKQISAKSQAVVVEGYTDVMAAHLSGVDTAVAVCGTAFGDDHARLLRRLMGDHDAFHGEVIFTFDGDRVTVDMGTPRVLGDTEVSVPGHTWSALHVDMGNPHAVAFLPADVDLDGLDLSRRPALDPEPADGANIELVSERGPHHVAMRVHERGVGETRSCGTGVAAVAVAAALRAGVGSRTPWTVDVPGGRLEVGWTEEGEVTLSGPAQLVADGTTLLSA